jgi:hypothetical protein
VGKTGGFGCEFPRASGKLHKGDGPQPRERWGSAPQGEGGGTAQALTQKCYPLAMAGVSKMPLQVLSLAVPLREPPSLQDTAAHQGSHIRRDAQGWGTPFGEAPPIYSGRICSCYCFEIGSGYAAQSGLEPTILLSLPPECWNYRHASPQPAQVRLPEQLLRAT